MADFPTSKFGAIFLSYAREDSDAARRLTEALRAAGLEVWFDQNELRGGETWDAKIRGQIRTCALFVAVISANTQARREGYFRREWKIAVDRTHDIADGVPFLVPVVIDDTPESVALVPAEFMRVQWTRLAGGRPTPAVVDQIKRLLDFPAPASAQAPRAVSPPTPPVAGRRAMGMPRWAWVVAGIGLLVGAGFWLMPRGVSPGSAGRNKSIAVLPFVNLGPEKADDYLGDGLTNELIITLSRVKDLHVPPRSSSFAFKGRTGEDLVRQVGEKLRVAHVLEGSVTRTGSKLRISVELVNVADGFHLWTDTYDRELTDLLEIQREVAQRVVKALQVQLGVEETRALSQSGTANPEAHRLYLQGRYHFNTNSTRSLEEALRCFQQAAQLDPGYALAYCGAADTYTWLGGNALVGREAWAKSKAMAEKALALQPDLADAHLSLGIAISSMCEWKPAEAAIRHALKLNPNLALAHDQLWWTLAVLGRFAEGFPHSQKAVELEPLSTGYLRSQAFGLYVWRKYDECLAQARNVLQMTPRDDFAHRMCASALLFKGDSAGAIQSSRAAFAADGTPFNLGWLGYVLGKTGDVAGVRQVIHDLEEMARGGRFVNTGSWVYVWMGQGDTAKALDWLEKAYAEQDWICWNLKVDPFLDPLRSEPRFQALLQKTGLAP